MKTDKDFKFNVLVSDEGYTDKQQITAAIEGGSIGRQLRKKLGLKSKLNFRPITTNPEELLELVLEGHTFCGLFNPPSNTKTQTYINADGCYTMSAKKSEFFCGSYFIGIDVDETSYTSIADYIQKLTFKPTFYYTSMSHLQKDVEGNSKGCRFRLIYVFGTLIKDSYYFRYCSYKLHQQIEQDVNEDIKDKCGLLCSQYFNGTNWNNKELNVDYGITNNIYNFDDLQITNEDYQTFLENNCFYKTLTKKQKQEINDRWQLLSHNTVKNNIHTQHLIISEWDKSCHPNEIEIGGYLLNDYDRLSHDEFYQMYCHKFPYIYRVEHSDWRFFDDIKYQYCQDGYLELKWIPVRIKDGQHRRRTLYHRGWLRRCINPNITPATLFFNLATDVMRFIDESRNFITAEDILDIVQQCFSMEVDDLQEFNVEDFQRDKERCSQKVLIIHRNSRGKINANKLKKELRWRLLDEAYNTDFTFAENLRILNDSDFEISRTALYRYCQDRGLINKKKYQDLYKEYVSLHLPSMSIREEVVYLKAQGLILSRPTIAKYRKKIEEENNKTVLKVTPC